MQEIETSVEQKLAEAARLIKEAGSMLEKVGLIINFEIKIKVPAYSSDEANRMLSG